MICFYKVVSDQLENEVLKSPLLHCHSVSYCTLLMPSTFSCYSEYLMQSTLRPPEVHICTIHFSVNVRFVWRLWGLILCMPCT